MGQFQGLEGGGVHVDQGLVLEVFPKGVRHSILGMGMGVQLGEIAKLEVNEVKKGHASVGLVRCEWKWMGGWLMIQESIEVLLTAGWNGNHTQAKRTKFGFKPCFFRNTNKWNV